MYRDVLVNKWFLGAFILCVICSIGCLLWYQNEMAKIQKETEAHEAFIAQLEDEKNGTEAVMKRTTPTGEIVQDEWDENVETAFVNEDTTEESNTGSEKTKTSGAVNNAASSKTKTRKVRVSPYGFGPYPEIPEDFPAGKFSFKGFSEGHELLMRVWIKLWKQGERVRGISFGDNGLVYPIIQGKVYVKYREVVSSDGTMVREATRYLGHPDDFPSIEDQFDAMTNDLLSLSRGEERPETITEIPSYLEILSFDEGIDPYKFLDLQKPEEVNP